MLHYKHVMYVIGQLNDYHWNLFVLIQNQIYYQLIPYMVLKHKHEQDFKCVRITDNDLVELLFSFDSRAFDSRHHIGRK